MPSVEQRKFLLQVPSSTENLAMIREFVNRIGEQAGFSPVETGKVELAVDEACANVIEHAYGSDTTKEVLIRATINDIEIEIEVIDTGRAFDPNAVELKNVEELMSARKSGGLGMRLIRTVMDEVHYQIIPGEKNELRMVKRLKKKSPPG